MKAKSSGLSAGYRSEDRSQVLRKMRQGRRRERGRGGGCGEGVKMAMMATRRMESASAERQRGPHAAQRRALDVLRLGLLLSETGLCAHAAPAIFDLGDHNLQLQSRDPRHLPDTPPRRHHGQDQYVPLQLAPQVAEGPFRCAQQRAPCQHVGQSAHHA